MRKESSLIVGLCLVTLMLAVQFREVSAETPDYDDSFFDIHGSKNITGIWGSMKLQTMNYEGSYCHYWITLLVIDYDWTNDHYENLAEINLSYSKNSSGSWMTVQAQAMKNGAWQTSPGIAYISTSYMGSNSLVFRTYQDGDTWWYHYSLNSGSTWSEVGHFDFDFTWSGDIACSGFENHDDLYFSSHPRLVGSSWGVDHRTSGSWTNTGFSSEEALAKDPKLVYSYSSDSITVNYDPWWMSPEQ